MPLSIRVKGLTELRERISRWNTAAWVAAVGPQAGEVLLASLKLYIAVKSGRTRDSLNFGYQGVHVVAFGDEVAGYLAWGTAPHDIFGFGKPLAFAWRGTPFVRWSVHHPGTRATFYREHAVETAKGELQSIGRQEALRLLGVA